MNSVPKTSGVYKITCTANGKIYVGSAINLQKRWAFHLWELRSNRHGNSRLQHAWNKYSESVFEFEIIELVMPWSRKDREQHWLDTLKPYNREVGFNVCKIAGETPSLIGHFVSAESRAKMSAAAKGRKQSAETIEKRMVKIRGRKLTPEHIEKVAAIHRGKKLKSEQVDNLAELNSRNYIVTSPDGIETQVRNLSKFCRENGLSNKGLSNVAYGFQSNYKGWKCRREKD